jgi:hypothetical protein
LNSDESDFNLAARFIVSRSTAYRSASPEVLHM